MADEVGLPQSSPIEILRKYWGYESFRPPQEDIIQSVLSGRDTLALLPTGGGKSICFQVPALCKEGICIVVSPLIALMKDQVYNLQRRGVPAEAIYSGQRPKDIDRILDNCIYGHIKLLYLSPERLLTNLAKARIAQMRVNLLAVDEAHCVSQWGYDFRPPYLQIPEIRAQLPGVPVLALTATATPEVVADIQEKLGFAQPHVIQKSFMRDNLAYIVKYEEGKDEKLVEILQKVSGSGVVYARNRKRTKEIATMLMRRGISADFYHAGLEGEERSKKQDAWISGQTRIMVSTNAFGMGIDKPDVRVVVHTDLPESLEAYFQEAGRAGRDGKKSFAVLLYNESDHRNLQHQFEAAFPPVEYIRQVYRALGSYYQLATGSGQGESYDFDLHQFCEVFKLEPGRTHSCLKVLEASGWIVLSEAVWTPSSLMVIADKEQVYDYMLRHPGMDGLFKSILRTHQGVFQHPVNIREEQLARFLQTSTDELTRRLQILAKEGIIDYAPRKDQPQLTFAQERVDPANLSIDMARYNFRKQRAEQRMRAAIDYAQAKECRSRMLLAYFGENDSRPCGVCDVCLTRRKHAMSIANVANAQTQLQQWLTATPLSLEQLSARWPASQREAFIKTLEYLMDEGFILEKEGLLYWNQ